MKTVLVPFSLEPDSPLPQTDPFRVLCYAQACPATDGGVRGLLGPQQAGDVVRARDTSLSSPDCPQVQCVHPYVAQQPDELTLELADILNILEKTDDGEGQGSGCISPSCPTPTPGTLHQPEG